MKFLRRIEYWLNHRKRAAELAEEIEFHRAMSEQPIGNTTLAREASRAVWIWPWLESVSQDLRYAVRNLRRQPGFTAVALLTLGAAIGLNTSLFTVYDAIALRMWTVRDPARMVKIAAKEPRLARLHGFSVPEFRYFAEHAQSLAGVIATNDGQVRLGFEGFGKGTYGLFVSANYFQVLGVPMELGRGFRSDEDILDAPENVAILSFSLWRDHFGSDREMVGKRIPIDDVPFIVVGVATENFSGTNPGREDIWMPLAAMQSLRPNEASTRQFLRSPFDCCSNVVARLAPGFSQPEAQAELAVLSRQFRKPLDIEPAEVLLFEPTVLAGFNKRGQILPAFAVLFAGLILVLLLACANVSNLLLARATARRREMEVRRALGASRARIVRQLLTEGFALALGASALGIALAWKLPSYLFAKMGNDGPNLKLSPDLGVAAYAVALACLACLAFAVAPALHGTHPHPRPRVPLRSVLLACQLTISMMLLTGAGLLLEGVEHARDHDPGYRIRDLAVISFELPASSYNQKRTREFSAQLERELESVPQLRPLGITALEPLARSHWHVIAALPGDAGNQHDIEFQEVTAGYFEVLGIPIVAGRNFQPGDKSDAARNAILINQTMARQLFEGVNPLGKTIVTGNTVHEIVGVARDTYLTQLDRFVPLFFQPFSGAQVPHLLVRADFPGAADVVAAIAKSIEPRARVQSTPLSANLDRELSGSRAGATIAGILGVFALALAAIGMSGVFAFLVEQRSKEIGIRMALGAAPKQVVALVLAGTARSALAGVAIGYLASAAVAKFIAQYLYGVSPFDSRAYVAAGMILALAGIAAAYFPARRATRIDPIRALRVD
jgi:predicted permease